MRLPPIKLPRWFYHRHYEYWLVAGAIVALAVIDFCVNYWGAPQ